MLGCASNASPPRRSVALDEKNSPPRDESAGNKDRSIKAVVWPIVIILVVVALDQITKLWALDYLSTRSSVSVIGDFFRLSLVFNTGGAMGTRIGPSVYYLVMALVVLPVLLYYIYRNRNHHRLAWPLAFIAGGAIGNLIDRIRLGKVVDFLDFDFFDIDFMGFTLDRFWAFNIADSAITCSIVYLVVVLMWFHHEPAEQRQVAPDEYQDNLG